MNKEYTQGTNLTHFTSLQLLLTLMLLKLFKEIIDFINFNMHLSLHASPPLLQTATSLASLLLFFGVHPDTVTSHFFDIVNSTITQHRHFNHHPTPRFNIVQDSNSSFFRLSNFKLSLDSNFFRISNFKLALTQYLTLNNRVIFS